MKWFLNIKTRTKLLVTLSAFLGLLLFVVFIAYGAMSSMEASLRKVLDEELATAVAIKDIRANQNGIRADQFAMMLETNRANFDLLNQDIKDRAKENDEAFQELKTRMQQEPLLKSKLAEFDSVRTDYLETRRTQVVPLIYDAKIQEAKRLIVGIQEERYQKMRTLANTMVDEAEQRARASVTLAEANARQSVQAFVLASIVALALCVVAVTFLNSVLAKPLNELSRATERVAAGDLTPAIRFRERSDEIGTLTQSFSRMLENFRQVNGEIRDGVNVLASSASEILAATTQVAAGAAETATAINETTTTVEEVKQTAQVASQKAKYVSDSAQKATQVAQTGCKSVEGSIEGMKRIQTQMESVAESIVKLSEQSQAIGEIIATVNDLAEQSNLLAVNAAIEAAKAGEQGKGFAVVALEVKSLAEQSKQATAQVRAILGDIQKATSTAVLATEQGSKAVESGVKQSAEAGEAIRVLADGVAEAAQAATQIAASSQQQLVGTDQVALAMENIKQASTQNVAGTKQAETAAHNLHELGQKLKQLVDKFKM